MSWPSSGTRSRSGARSNSAYGVAACFSGSARSTPIDTTAIDTTPGRAEEEVGLPRERVSVIGRLDTYVTGTGFEIAPIVGVVDPPVPISIDPFEVAEAFEVPLAFILDRRNHQRIERDVGAHSRSYFVLPFEGRNIWGATAGILVNLAEVLAD